MIGTIALLKSDIHTFDGCQRLPELLPVYSIISAKASTTPHRISVPPSLVLSPNPLSLPFDQRPVPGYISPQCRHHASVAAYGQQPFQVPGTFCLTNSTTVWHLERR